MNISNLINKTVKAFLIEDSRSTNVRAMEKELHKSSSITNTKGRIDNPSDFRDSFDVWFKTLGYDPQENPISLSQVRNDVEKVLRDLGYK